MSFDPSSISGLNVEAWNRWLAYKVVKKQSYKEMSLPALALKLTRFGDASKQSEVVEQSIANNWSGLFDIKEPNSGTGKPIPGKRTKEEQSAAEQSFAYAVSLSEKRWAAHLEEKGTVAQLQMCDALMTRYEVAQDTPMMGEMRAWLKDKVAEIIRVTDPKAILSDYVCWRLVLQLFGDRGLLRLEERAKNASAST